MNILSQSSLLVAIVSFALGFSVLARNPRNKLFIHFAVVCTVVSGWALFFFLAQVWNRYSFYRWHLFFHLWLAPASLAFIRAMVRSQRLGRTMLRLALAASAALTACLGLGIERMIPWVMQLMLFAPAFVAVQVLLLMLRERRQSAKAGKDSTSRNLIYLGALGVLMLSVQDHVPWAGPAIPVVGNLALTVYLFFLGQAVTQQRFLNFGAAFSRFLVVLGVALTLTALYSLLFAWIEHSFPLFLLNSFIVSFMVLMLLEPLQKMVRYFTGQLLTKKYQRLAEELRLSQRRLATVVDPGALHRDLLDVIRRTLEPDWAALFVLRADGTLLRRAQVIGQEPPGSRAPFEVISDHALIAHCRKLRQSRGQLPVVLDQALEAEIERSASKSQRERLTGLLEALRALESNLLIPLLDQDRCLGFVTAKVPALPEPWSGNWGLLQLIYPYFEQAALAMRSMEVYARSREKERLAELGQMAAGLAHEIRNPLGAIKGAAQFLDPSGDRPDSRFLKIIVDEVDRLNRVVTQFLEFSKPRALVLAAADASQLAQRTVEFLRPGVPAGIELEFEPSAGPAPIRASGEQIQQVLVNLIQNSVCALERRPGQEPRAGRVRVRVRTETGGERRSVILEVEDNGPGIPEENLERIFVPFFTTRPSGTGLGLSICQRIVEAHRGRIEVSTEPGSFARFSVILPAEA